MQTRKIIDIITILFITLWMYAAVSKLLDYETFKVQLGKSPLLNSMETLVAVGIPLIEILLAVLLLMNRTRLVGLYGSLLLMVAFTTYIIAILNFSYYIPCSCGGILSSLGWREHLIFNISFIVMAITAILLSAVKRTHSGKKREVLWNHPPSRGV